MQLLKSLIYPLRGIDNTTTGQVAPLSEHKKLSPTALDIIFYILLRKPCRGLQPRQGFEELLSDLVSPQPIYHLPQPKQYYRTSLRCKYLVKNTCRDTMHSTG